MKNLLKTLLSDTNPLRLAYHRVKSAYTAWKAGYPAKNLRVIGITGTDGKTTTVAMVAHILNAAGKSVGAASTAFLEVRGKREPNPTQKTSLTSAEIQAFLQRLVDEHCEFAIVEVSSHGLMQGRLSGIHPEIAAITNISMEHLDYHGSMEEYIRAKGMLFQLLKDKGVKVLNADDETYASYTQIPSEKTFIYSPRKQLVSVHGDALSTGAQVIIDDVTYDLELQIPGTFNLHNALCAIHCAKAAGVSVKKSIEALRTFRGTPGRMQRIDAGQSYSVFIDFTVTPVAYQRTLDSLRTSMKPGGRLLVLTGSCGDRMPEKRPLVGEICSQKADIVVVTNEDPYTEDPEKIIDEVLSGVKTLPIFYSIEEYEKIDNQPPKFCVRVSDRLEAIRFLLKQAKGNDSILFAGKGSDVTMMTKSGQIPWVETEIVEREIRSLAAHSAAPSV